MAAASIPLTTPEETNKMIPNPRRLARVLVPIVIAIFGVWPVLLVGCGGPAPSQATRPSQGAAESLATTITATVSVPDLNMTPAPTTTEPTSAPVNVKDLSGSIHIAGGEEALRRTASVLAIAYSRNESGWSPIVSVHVSENGQFRLDPPGPGTYRLGFFDPEGILQAKFYPANSTLETAGDINVSPEIVNGPVLNVDMSSPHPKAEMRLATTTTVRAPSLLIYRIARSIVPAVEASESKRLMQANRPDVQLGIEADGTTTLYTPQDPIPLSGSLVITYTMDCGGKNIDVERLTQKTTVLCMGADCDKTPLPSPAGTFRWTVPLNKLHSGDITARWACSGGKPDNAVQLAQVQINDPSGRVTTGQNGGGTEVPGVVVDLYRLEGKSVTNNDCRASTDMGKVTAAATDPMHRWHNDWSGFSSAGSNGKKASTYTTGQPGSPSSGFYGWTTDVLDACYYVVVNLGSQAQNGCTAGTFSSPVIGYVAAQAIEHLDLRCAP
jgi:hypothetical protein